MKRNQSNDQILRENGIKPCSIKIDNMLFSRIKMTCTVTSSEKNEKLKCCLRQEDDINTFSLKIKRKLCNDTINEIPPLKRVKFNDVEVIHHIGKSFDTSIHFDCLHEF